DPARPLRGGGDGRNEAGEGVLAHHAAAPDAQPFGGHRVGADPRRADLRRGLRADRRRAGHLDAVPHPVHLRDRVRLALAQPRPGGGGIDPDGPRAGGADADPAPARPSRRTEGGARMSSIVTFLARRRGGRSWHWTDIVTWVWLVGGLIIMFGPAVWLVGSSFKTPGQLAEFPPTILPYVSQKAMVEGYDKPLTLYRVMQPDGSTKVMAEVRRVGIVAQMVDPEAPGEIVKINISERRPVRQIGFATENYVEPLKKNDFLLYLRNSVFVTLTATLITLITNS